MRGHRLGDCDDGWALVVGNMLASFSGDFSSSTHLTECRNGSPKNFGALLFRDEVQVPSESSVAI